MSAEHVIVMSTTDSEESALALASGAVESGLGACAQIVGPITSVFRWDGAVQTEREWRVEVKTAGDRAPVLVEHIEANHGYDVPEVVTVPVVGGSGAYLSWVAEETR